MEESEIEDRLVRQDQKRILSMLTRLAPVSSSDNGIPTSHAFLSQLLLEKKNTTKLEDSITEGREKSTAQLNNINQSLNHIISIIGGLPSVVRKSSF